MLYPRLKPAKVWLMVCTGGGAIKNGIPHFLGRPKDGFFLSGDYRICLAANSMWTWHDGRMCSCPEVPSEELYPFLDALETHYGVAHVKCYSPVPFERLPDEWLLGLLRMLRRNLRGSRPFAKPEDVNRIEDILYCRNPKRFRNRKREEEYVYEL